MEIMGYNITEFKGFKIDMLAVMYEAEFKRRFYKHFNVTELEGFPVSVYGRLSVRDKGILEDLIKYARYMDNKDKQYVLSKVKLPISDMPDYPLKKISTSIRIEKVYRDIINDNGIHENFTNNLRQMINEWIDLKQKRDVFDKRVRKEFRMSKKVIR